MGSRSRDEESEQAGFTVLPGRSRSRFRPLYDEILLYAPLIGSDALALYCLLLTFGQSPEEEIRPASKELCRLLHWSPGRLRRQMRVLEAAGMIERTASGSRRDRPAVRVNDLLPEAEFERNREAIEAALKQVRRERKAGPTAGRP